MRLTDTADDRRTNPLDVIETVAALEDWSFERAAEDEIAVAVAGLWTDYHVSFSWMAAVEALHVGCAFNLKVDDKHRAEALKLVAGVNEMLWLGHFDLWSRDGVVMYRNTLLLSDGVDPTSAQVSGLLAAAIDACDRYYQAFQFVVWAGKSAREALDSTLFETHGEA